MKHLTAGSHSHRQRIWLWLSALILILACVPATSTPPPTLDSNQINLLIQQTADAASIQTLTARPTLTFTPTFTATPRDTSTPEPTNTPFITFVLPSITPAQVLQYYRVKHDTQLAIYNYKSRSAAWDKNPQTPEVVPMFISPKDGSGTHRTVIDGSWEYYMDALNNFDRGKLKFLKASNTALFNSAGFPQMESLTMGGNIITLEQVSGNWGKVHTMSYGKAGSVETENYGTRPDIVHKFVLVVWSRKTKSTYWANPPKGDIYWPLVSSKPVWIPMDRLEKFPSLPMEVTAEVEQELRREPGSEGALTGKTIAEGESVTIIKYQPMGSEVWAMTQSTRWLVLFKYTGDGPTYFTSWKMDTVPPIP